MQGQGLRVEDLGCKVWGSGRSYRSQEGEELVVIQCVDQSTADGSNVCRGGSIPSQTAQAPTVGLWKITLLNTGLPVPEMCSQCKTDQSS